MPLFVNFPAVANTWTQSQTFQGQLLSANGTVSLPTYTFSGAPTTGIFYGSDLLQFGHTGTSIFSINLSGLTPTLGINAAGGFSASPRNVHTGGNPALNVADGTNLDIVITELYVAEVFIPANCTVTGMSVFNGANTNGNMKVMLFSSSGSRVAISASTDVSGHTADAYGTRIPFGTPYSAVGPATYYVGVICDTNTHDLNVHTVGNFGAGKITGLTYGTEAGYATISVPTTFTADLGPIATLY
jgi:hypothetical protein